MAESAIIGFHLDEENHWVARLACGHNQHVRHQPPWQNRPWTQTKAGRDAQLGVTLTCLKCERDEPIADWAVSLPSLSDENK